LDGNFFPLTAVSTCRVSIRQTNKLGDRKTETLLVVMVLMPSLPWGEKNREKNWWQPNSKTGFELKHLSTLLDIPVIPNSQTTPQHTHQPTHWPIQSKLTKRKTVWRVVLKCAVPWTTTKFTPTPVWTILLRHPPSQPPTPKRLLDLHTVKTMRCTPPQSTPHHIRRYFPHSHTQWTASRFSTLRNHSAPETQNTNKTFLSKNQNKKHKGNKRG